MALALASHIPSPPANGFHIGPAFIHFYGLMYVVGITLAVIITRRRWQARGGDPALVADVATWAVPFGIVGARIYFDITTPGDIPHHWWGVFAVWSGGLGVWGGIAAGAAAGIWRVRKAHGEVRVFMECIAPALLVAQGIGRIGNYFNQELFGKPSTLPWALAITPHNRPPGYVSFPTFQPTFLYELIFDLALAGLLVWLGRRGNIRPPGLFALYVTGYSAFRIFEETLRIDSSEHIFGLRLNFYIATILAVSGAVWFIRSQRGQPRPSDAQLAHPGTAGGPDAGDGPAGDGLAGDGLAGDGLAGDDPAGPDGASEAAQEPPAASESELAAAADDA
jgi:prolipoprotein diacylglyceryl transferase